MPGVSFDRAAGYYDATRGYTPGVAEQIRAGLLEATAATSSDRWLEIGIGTGRIALPFIEHGHFYVGADLARAMLQTLRSKLDSAVPDAVFGLFQADATHLPFATASFDVVLAVHVLHLVDGWQAAVQEVRRVLRPGGRLVLAGDESAFDRSGPPANPDQPLPAQAQYAWSAILADLGYETTTGQPGVRNSDPALHAHLAELGATVRTVKVAEYERQPTSARTVVERYRQRIYSSNWAIPDQIYAEAIRRLDAWLAACPDPDRLAPTRGHFTAVVAAWPVEKSDQ